MNTVEKIIELEKKIEKCSANIEKHIGTDTPLANWAAHQQYLTQLEINKLTARAVKDGEF